MLAELPMFAVLSLFALLWLALLRFLLNSGEVAVICQSAVAKCVLMFFKTAHSGVDYCFIIPISC